MSRFSIALLHVVPCTKPSYHPELLISYSLATLEHNKTIKVLTIEDNDITDDICPFIVNNYDKTKLTYDMLHSIQTSLCVRPL